MKNYLFAILCFLFVQASFAQTKITIKGKVQDAIALSLVDTNVKLVQSADSLVIVTARTNENGSFSLEISPQNQPTTLIIEDDLEGTYKQTFATLTAHKDLGIITISPTVYDLNEVFITNNDPIVIKQDTIEYNAASFTVKPNANLEELLKELPGFEMDDQGKITVNGKSVNEILIDGESFFGTDGKVALENLPADIVKKIQVSDFKTRNEKFSGERAKSDKSTLNITLKEDKKEGYMVKATGGYGTDNHYEGNLMANYFKGKQRWSIIGSSTDIAASGLVNGEGSRGRRMMSVRGSSGLSSNSSIGLNFNDDLSERLKIGADYRFNHAYNKNKNYTRQENLLPENNYTTESNSKSTNETFGHSLGTNLEWKNDKTKIFFYPTFNHSLTNSTTASDRQSYSEDGTLRNESTTNNKDESRTNAFANTASLYHLFNNKTYLNLSSNISVNTSKQDTRINQSTLFYQAGLADDIRDQTQAQKNTNNSYSFDARYTMPILDSVTVSVGSVYQFDHSKNDQNTWDYDPVTGDFTILNTRLSRLSSTDMNKLTPFAEIALEKTKFSGSLRVGADFYSQDNHSIYAGNPYDLTIHKTLPSLEGNLRYQLGLSQLFFRYNYQTNLPSTNQLLAIEDVSDPLNIFVGNPDLEASKAHNLNFMYGRFDRKTRQGFNANVNYTYNSSSIVNYSFIDENLVNRSTYKSIEGNYRLSGNLFFNKQLAAGVHKFRMNVGLMSSYARQQGYKNTVDYQAFTSTLSPSLRLNWDYNKYVTLSPSYSLRFTHTKYDNYSIDQQENITHNMGLRTITTWPENLTWTNDVSYNRSSKMAAGFKQDFFLWNTTLSYAFFDKKFEAAVKIYDIFNQNNDYTRTITEESIRDERNTILKRFMLFSITYNLNQFGGKKRDYPN